MWIGERYNILEMKYNFAKFSKLVSVLSFFFLPEEITGLQVI